MNLDAHGDVLRGFSAGPGGESIDVEMKLEAALDTRDALAKSIYAAIFKCVHRVVHCGLVALLHAAALRIAATCTWHGALSACTSAVCAAAHTRSITCVPSHA
jgi:hypothetical protein